jgi:hypothetical protein
MKIEIESTTRLVELELPGGARVPARIWEGETESGIKVHAYITRIAVGEDQDCTQFDAELRDCRAPSAAVAAIPLRLIL